MTKQEPITMANHANVHVALAAAQADMRLPEKNAENPGFKRDGKPMKYADLSSVVESIRVPLTRHGLAWGWRSAFSADAGLWVWDAYIVHGASGTEVSCAVPVNSGTGNSHAFKSAVTYAKRIGLESVSGQAPGDDDDGNAAAKSPPVVEPPRSISADQFTVLRDLIEETGTDIDKFLTAYRVETLPEFPANMFEKAKGQLERKREAAQ